VPDVVCGITVSSKYGNIVGLTASKGHTFFGIAYALPPVGDIRYGDEILSTSVFT
jgi:carboxylesterase type B